MFKFKLFCAKVNKLEIVSINKQQNTSVSFYFKY